jgi:hypothetical protein
VGASLTFGWWLKRDEAEFYVSGKNCLPEW